MAQLIEAIRSQALAFRRALERVAPESKAVALGQFPRGSCGDVTDLLGTYLQEKHGFEFDYVVGESCRPEEQGGWFSHAWLQCDSLIIDITADQFPDVSESVIITRDSAWHRTFERRRLRVADFRRGGSCEMAELRKLYEKAARLADAD